MAIMFHDHREHRKAGRVTALSMAAYLRKMKAPLRIGAKQPVQAK